MEQQLRVNLEVGPRAKKVVAVAPDWPGLERGGKSGEAAIATLRAYLPRYAKVAKLAGMDQRFAASTHPEVIEEYSGTGSTDFWGISFAFAGTDRQLVSQQELSRELKLLEACWAYFDGVRSRVSAEMRKGARGGGRDRDRIVGHVLRVEQDWAGKLGVQTPDGELVSEDPGLKTYRAAVLAAIGEFHAQGRQARTWPLRYLIRHSAYHTMDHAWEMEDKDLSAAAP